MIDDKAKTQGGSIQPLPWLHRDGNVPDIPGGVGSRLENFRRLLEAIGDGLDAAEQISWPAGEIVIASEAVRRASKCGVISRDGQWVSLTAAGKDFLESGNPVKLVEVFHRHVRFFGEILHLLAESNRTTDELRRLACSRYGMPWSDVHQVRSRTEWLRELGMVELVRRRSQLMLTDLGKEVAARLQAGVPPAGDLPESTLPPSVRVMEALNDVGPKELDERDRKTNVVIPKGRAGLGFLDVVQSLVTACTHSASLEEINEAIVRVSASENYRSAKAVVTTLEKTGLIDLVGDQTWKTTSLAGVWLESGNPADLAGIVHTRLWYFVEILRDLSELGKCSVKALKDRAREIDGSKSGSDPVNDNAMRGRLHVLQACGYVAKVGLNYLITGEGRAFLERIPHLSQAVGVPQVQQDGPNIGQVPIKNQSVDDTSALSLASDLEESSRDSDDPERFERLVVEALQHLGLKAEHIGGSGHPDGKLRTDLGIWGEDMLIEAKTASKGLVSQEGARILSWEKHRDQYDVHKTLVIGPGFEEIIRDKANKDEQVALVLADTLAACVRRQATSPLMPEELSTLFSTHHTDRERHGVLEQKWTSFEASRNLMACIIGVLADEVDRPEQWQRKMDNVAICRDLITRFPQMEINETDVEAALNFFTHPFVGVVQASNEPDDGSNKNSKASAEKWYRLAIRPDIGRQRVRALSVGCMPIPASH